MDYNLTVISGTLTTPPEISEFAIGSAVARFLITTRVESPRRRVDVLPVVCWADEDGRFVGYTSEDLADWKAGEGVFVTGTIQRRFWSNEGGRSSRLEIVAHSITKSEKDMGVEE